MFTADGNPFDSFCCHPGAQWLPECPKIGLEASVEGSTKIICTISSKTKALGTLFLALLTIPGESVWGGSNDAWENPTYNYKRLQPCAELLWWLWVLFSRYRKEIKIRFLTETGGEVENQISFSRGIVSMISWPKGLRWNRWWLRLLRAGCFRKINEVEEFQSQTVINNSITEKNVNDCVKCDFNSNL